MARPPENQVDESAQAKLLDLNTKQYNPYWQDPQQPLIVPVNPLHYEAHELQLLLNKLKVQAERNPAQFNSKNYIDVLSRLSALWTQINNGGKVDDAVADDQGNVGTDGKRSTAPEVGNGIAAGLDPGISPDNPFAGQGPGAVRAVAVSAGIPTVSRPLPSDQ